jgi:hypothetical protein
MKVIKPVTVTPAMLVSSSATEAHSDWAIGTTYALDAKVLRNYRIYQCIQGPSTGNTPETSPLYWTDIGPTNKWAMFDNQISTGTTAATTLTVVLDPGYINSIALVGVEGSSVTVTALDEPSGATVYSKTVNLDNAIITDWYQYFFEPFSLFGDVVLTDIPTYSALRLTVVITGATIEVGNISVGTMYFLGKTDYGATAGIIDYSRKDTSATGVTTFTQRNYSKRMGARMMLDTSKINLVQRVLADVRATPCVWIGSDDTSTYAPLVVYGFYRDFSIEVAYHLLSYCSLEVEGLT